MSEKRVVRKKPEGPTSPGDTISIGISGEINAGGGKMWPRFGVDSVHRPGETSDEAVERISDFVMTTFEEFVEALK